MPGSSTVEQNLISVLARVEEISTSEGAQQFADVTSGVRSLFNHTIYSL